MSVLMDRYCRVVIGSLLLEGFRVQFRVARSIDTDPNTLDLHVFNLKKSTRDELSSQGSALIWIDAGYKDDHGQLYSGNAASISHVRSGPDWATHVLCGENLAGLTGDTVSRSYQPGAQVGDVLRDVIKTMSVDGSQALARLGQGDLMGGVQTLAQGFAAFGNSYSVLGTIAKAKGFDWTIQDGKLILSKKGEVSPANSFVRLASNSGLLTSPDSGAKRNPTTGAMVTKARALLMARLRPMGGVRIVSDGGRSGDYRIDRVAHSGDTHGPEWYSDLELEPAHG